MNMMFNSSMKTLNQMRVKPEQNSTHNGACDDLKWSDKAIKLLVKKMKKTGDLERALTAKSPHSSCVLTARLLDLGSSTSCGNQTKSHSLQHASYVFCKIWRWADLQSIHELKSVDTCNYPLTNKHQEEVCVNPYHYIRVEKPSLPPVLIPSGGYSICPSTTSDVPPASYLPAYESTQIHTPANSDCSSDYPFPDSNLSARDPMLNVQSYATPPPAYTSEESASDRSSPPSFGNCLSNPNSPYFGSHSSNTTLPSPESATIYPQQNCYDSSSFGQYTTNSTIRFEEQKHWCTIHYYEMENRVGEPFHAAKPTLFIDGFTDPGSDERFCLGLLGNIHREQDIEVARRHINKGVKLTYIAGEVFAECLSDSAIFVQSPNCNLSSGWHPATVCKLPPSCTLKIFNYQEFAQLLSNSVSKGYEAVFQLTRMCTIRISFVKGWGAEYRRQTVTSTPCWIEIHLNGALQWLDRVLQGMGTPLNTCSSRS